MTDKEIFEKALKKARLFSRYSEIRFDSYHQVIFVKIISGHGTGYEVTAEHILFSLDFAKAFWGNKGTGIFMTCLCADKCGHNKELKEWMPHLQQMVLEKEPIKYLEKFL